MSDPEVTPTSPNPLSCSVAGYTAALRAACRSLGLSEVGFVFLGGVQISPRRRGERAQGLHPGFSHGANTWRGRVCFECGTVGVQHLGVHLRLQLFRFGSSD